MPTGASASSLHEARPRNDTPPVPLKRAPHVTPSTPAKRITFFKSGDARFVGVKMAVGRRSFKSFDALLDDLSHKVPLPFGVRTVTTPRGTHRISQLEQLQDGGCYLCSDRHCVKPVDLEAAGKGPVVWRHSQPHSGRRKPSRPEEAAVRVASRYPRHPKRIVLVKNTDPALRRSIIVSRRSARSLQTFMGEISELMSCHIRKLYTLDGREIDSLQSLIQCPNVLVCVGQEPFRPLLVESFRKSSDEKLPGLRNRSQSRISSKGQESRKNDSVNFGLEAKKSVIHPRPDSSNRSTRFSLSSEKSYPNGLNTSPGHSGYGSTCSHTKGSLTNDDIEKRVVVNKDGSLSVHMRVRFRLLNDETLQWSTEIKKSAIGTECCLGKDQASGLQQEKTQSFSEPESISGCDAEDSYTAKMEQMHLEESHCQNCCNHCQEYDIWKNPLHGDLDRPRPASSKPTQSSSSSTSSHKIICKKESVESMRTVSCSSEEYRERVLEKATCIQRTAEDGDFRLEYCSISRCCSHSETCTTSTRSGGRTTWETCPHAPCDHPRPDSGSSVSSHREQLTVKVNGVAETEERPVSAISNSSKVLEALREDQDDDVNDEDEDLPHSASRGSDKPHVCKSAISIKLNCSNSSASPVHFTPRCPSKDSSCSAHSLQFIEPENTASPEPDTLPGEAEQEDDDEKRRKRGASSRQSSKDHGKAEPEDTQRDRKRALSSRVSRASRTSEHCCCVTMTPAGLEVLCQCGAGEEEEMPFSNTSTGERTLSRSRNECVYPHCYDSNGTAVTQASESTAQIDMEAEADPRSVSVASARSNVSIHSIKSNRFEHTTGTEISTASEISENPPNGDTGQDEMEPGNRATSAASAQSRVSEQCGNNPRSLCSACSQSAMVLMVSVCPAEGQEEGKSRPEQSGSLATLVKSEDSNREGTNGKGAEEEAGSVEGRVAKRALIPKPKGVTEDNRETEDLNGKRPASTISANTYVSANLRRPNSSQGNLNERAITPETSPEETAGRAANGMPNCAKSPATSKASTKPSAKFNNTGYENTERTLGTVSAKSSSSGISRRSEDLSAAAEMNGDVGPLKPEKRAESALSLNFNASVISGSPSKLLYNGHKDASDRDSRPATPESGQQWDDRADHTCSVQQAVPGKSEFNKGHFVASEKEGAPEAEADSERVTRPTSAKSAKSQHNASQRLVPPTSMVSISVSVGEEQAANHAEETAWSPVTEQSLASAQSTKSKGQSKRVTPETPVLPCETEDSSQQTGTPTSASPEVASGSETEVASVKSTSTRKSRKSESEPYLYVHNHRTSSAMSKVSRKKSASKHSRIASKTSGAAENARKFPNEVEKKVDAISDEEVSSVSSRNSRHKDKGESIMPRPMSKASTHTTSKSTMKNHCIAAAKRPKSSQSNASSRLQVKQLATKPDRMNGSVCSVKNKSSKEGPINNSKMKEASRPNSVCSQFYLSPQKEMSHSHEEPAMLLENSGDNVLSNSLSAADLLRKNCDSRQNMGRPQSTSESIHNGAPDTIDSGKHVNDDKSEKSCKSRARKGSNSSQQKVEDDMSELLPSCLPGTSPLEVVNEWLKKIPSESSIYEVGDNFEEHSESKEAAEGQKEPGHLTNDVTNGDQASEGGKKQQEGAEAAEEVKEEICAQEAVEHEHPDTTDMLPSPGSKCFAKGYRSSIQVMKVLLSSQLDRCNSLPEVSPVYGQKLSASAKGLLDCVTKLQLAASDPADVKAKSDKYQEVMEILQKLWTTEPMDCKQTRQESQPEDHSPDHECNPKSSSGVDASGNSGECGKTMGTLDQAQKVVVSHRQFTPVLEQDAQQEATDDREEMSQQAPEDESDSATPDIASRVQGTPGGGETDEPEDKEEGLASEKTFRSSESPKDVTETVYSSKKSSGNDSNPEKFADETDPLDASSGMPACDQRAQVTGKPTQDLDPVWVLNLLQKMEKQFMTHYMTAMAEFKVRWDLDESVLLDTMINELKDEVHKRIQSSISQELRKIQGRNGGPRPPVQAVSRESTLQTELRRRRLKVMRNKSIYSSLSRSEENLTATATATDYSDQRSDDDFCPCDTCMKKKEAARCIPVATANPPPLMKDFDLKTILQKKHEPPRLEQTGQQKVLARNGEGGEEESEEEEEYSYAAEKSNQDQIQTQEGENKGAGEQGDVTGGDELDKGAGEQGDVTGGDELDKGAGEQGDVTGGDELDQTVEAEVEEGAAEGDGTGEGHDEAEDIAEAEEEKGDKERVTEAGEIAASQGETVEDSKAEDGAEDRGDEGCATSDNKAEVSQNEQIKKEDREEKEVDNENKEVCSEDRLGADADDSGPEHLDKKIRRERCGKEGGTVQETNGKDNTPPNGEEENDLKYHLMRQITKSSMESQQGSAGNSMDLEPEGKTEDIKNSQINCKARSNHMYPASSEECAVDTEHSSTGRHKMAKKTVGNVEGRHVATQT